MHVLLHSSKNVVESWNLTNLTACSEGTVERPSCRNHPVYSSHGTSAALVIGLYKVYRVNQYLLLHRFLL